MRPSDVRTGKNTEGCIEGYVFVNHSSEIEFHSASLIGIELVKSTAVIKSTLNLRYLLGGGCNVLVDLITSRLCKLSVLSYYRYGAILNGRI